MSTTFVLSDADWGRLWSRVSVGEEFGKACWPWLGATSRAGYAQMGLHGKVEYVHRIMYAAVFGGIPGGLQIDHLCRNRSCVNPGHLEAVTQKRNILRGESPSAQQARQTHCKRGHLLEGENLRVTTTGQRRCRTCLRLLGAKYRAQRRAALVGFHPQPEGDER